MTEPVLHSSHLFTLSLTVDPNFTDVGETPYGRRRIATVTGGCCGATASCSSTSGSR